MLGAATDRALPFLRTQAESRMKAQCVIRRVAKQDVNPLTGQTVTTFQPADVYAGRCRVKNKSSASEVDSAGALVVVLSDEVHIPWDSCAFRVNDIIEITAHRRANLVGTKYRIVELADGDDLTAHRIPVERWA